MTIIGMIALASVVIAAFAIFLLFNVHRRNLLDLRWPAIQSEGRFAGYCAAYLHHKGWKVVRYSSGSELYIEKGNLRVRLFCREGIVASRTWISDALATRPLGSIHAIVTNGIIRDKDRETADEARLCLIHYSELNRLEEELGTNK